LRIKVLKTYARLLPVAIVALTSRFVAVMRACKKTRQTLWLTGRVMSAGHFQEHAAASHNATSRVRFSFENKAAGRQKKLRYILCTGRKFRKRPL
jgi:hypothetical protein